MFFPCSLERLATRGRIKTNLNVSLYASGASLTARLATVLSSLENRRYASGASLTARLATMLSSLENRRRLQAETVVSDRIIESSLCRG